MPSEAKFSPGFQEVRPDTVPLHSFCQIFFPIRVASAGESLISEAAGADDVMKIRPRKSAFASDHFCLLDGCGLSISVQPPVALNLKRNPVRNSTFMKYFIAIFATVALALPVFADEKSTPAPL